MKALIRRYRRKPLDASRRSLPAFVREAAGNVAVEFAFLLPILAYSFVGAVDLGFGIYREMQVKQAAQVGAEYAVVNGFNEDAIAKAITNATSYSGVAADPAPTSFCGCVSNNAIVGAACGSYCSDGNMAGTYATVHASRRYSTLFRYPYIPDNFNMSAKATVRLQ